MAETKKTTTRKTTRAVAKTTAPATEATEEVVKKPIKLRDIDVNQYITVRNGFQGRLIYKSSHTGEVYDFEEFGSEQEIELKELKSAKNSAKKFFEKNWFMFDDEWVIDYLGVRNFYKNSIKIEDLDEVLTTSNPDELAKVLSDIPDGQKQTISYRARNLIADGEIDSRKSITAIENVLGIKLIEED